MCFRFKEIITAVSTTGAGIVQSVQRLATGWTVRGSNPGGGEIFRTNPDRPWGLPGLLYNGYRLFPGGKAAAAWRWPPTPSRAEVKERVELNLHSPYGLSWPVLRWNLAVSTTDINYCRERKVQITVVVFLSVLALRNWGTVRKYQRVWCTGCEINPGSPEWESGGS